MRHRVVPGDRGGSDGWGYRRGKARVDTEVVTLKDKEWKGGGRVNVLLKTQDSLNLMSLGGNARKYAPPLCSSLWIITPHYARSSQMLRFQFQKVVK